MDWYILRAGPSNQNRHWSAAVKEGVEVDPFFSDPNHCPLSYKRKRAQKITIWALIHMGKLNKAKAKDLVKQSFWPDEIVPYDELCVKVYGALKNQSRRRGTSLVRCLTPVSGNVVLVNRDWIYGN